VITALLVGVIVVCFSFGDIALARGMKQAGEVSSLSLAVLDRVGGRAIRSPFVLIGERCRSRRSSPISLPCRGAT